MPALHTLSTEILVYTQIPNAPIFSLYTQRCSLLIPQIFGSLHFSRVYTMVNYKLYLQCDAIKRLGWSYSETIHCTVNHPNQNLIQCIQVHICAYLLKLLFIFVFELYLYFYLYFYFYGYRVCTSPWQLPCSLICLLLHRASKSKRPFWCSAPLLVCRCTIVIPSFWYRVPWLVFNCTIVR